MNKRIIAAIVLMIICSIWAVHSQQKTATDKTPVITAKQQVKPVEAFPELDSYGALQAVKDAKGENFFGKGSPAPFDGYAVAYRIGEMQFDKNDIQIVSAIKDQTTKEKLKVKPGAQSQSALAQTTDGVLLITSKVSVDKQTGKLEVTRTVRNTSSKPVSLIAFEVQADQRFSRYKEPVNFDFKPRSLPPFDTQTILPLGGNGCCNPKTMNCMNLNCSSSCINCPEGYLCCPVEGISSSENPGIGIRDFFKTSPHICVLQPKICRQRSWLVSHWSAGVNLPAIPLKSEQEITFKAIYHLR